MSLITIPWIEQGFMAENEVNTAINHARYTEAVNAGKTMKRWVSIIDEVH